MPMIVVHFESDSPHTTSESEEISVISSILVVFSWIFFELKVRMQGRLTDESTYFFSLLTEFSVMPTRMAISLFSSAADEFSSRFSFERRAQQPGAQLSAEIAARSSKWVFEIKQVQTLKGKLQWIMSHSWSLKIELLGKSCSSFWAQFSDNCFDINYFDQQIVILRLKYNK